MAANTLKFFLPMTGFLDTEIVLAIKPTPQNKGQNVETKYWLNGRDLRQLFYKLENIIIKQGTDFKVILEGSITLLLLLLRTYFAGKGL